MLCLLYTVSRVFRYTSFHCSWLLWSEGHDPERVVIIVTGDDDVTQFALHETVFIAGSAAQNIELGRQMTSPRLLATVTRNARNITVATTTGTTLRMLHFLHRTTTTEPLITLGCCTFYAAKEFEKLALLKSNSAAQVGPTNKFFLVKSCIT